MDVNSTFNEYSFHNAIDISREDAGTENIRAVEAGDFTFVFETSPGSGEWTAHIFPPGLTNGWHYGHVQGDDGVPLQLDQVIPGVHTASYGDLLGTMAEITDKHIHFFRTDQHVFQNGIPGVDNPLDYLDPVPNSTNGYVWEIITSNPAVFFLPQRDAIYGSDSWTEFYDPPTPGYVNPSIVLNDTLNRNELYGPVDVMHGVFVKGYPQSSAVDCSGIPHKIEWILYRVLNSSLEEQFRRYVVDFDGVIGAAPGHWQEFRRLYFPFFAYQLFWYPGIPNPGAPFFCLTNCSDATGYNGIDNIKENCWETNVDISGSGAATLPENAMYPDGSYEIDVTSYAFDDTELSITTEVVVDNFIPSIEEVIVYSFRFGIQPGNRVDTMYTEIWEDSTSSIRKRTSTAYGYLPSVNSGLGVAVRYSEIMDPENMGYYWFTGERADELVYSTENDRDRWLLPVEGFRSGLDIVPSSPEAAYWQSYETSGDCSIDEIGYVGKLRLHIGDLSTPKFALDLAGNDMDYDPSSIATPRDPVTGQFDYSKVEPVPYDTEVWGNHPFWVWNSPRALVDGFLDNELVATVDLEEIGLGPSGLDAEYVANNRYWCGFWMRHSKGGAFNEFWPIVDFLGGYTQLVIYTEFQVMGGGSGNQQYWHHHSFHEPIMSPDTRYMWTTGYTVDWLHTPHEESKAYAYCLDSETGLVQPHLLGVGWVWDDGPLDNSTPLLHDFAVSVDSSRWVNTSFTEILSVDVNGVAEVRYGYYTSPDVGGLVEDIVLIDPPFPGEDFSAALDERPIDTPEAEITAETTTNPIHDVLTVNLLASSGSRYEIVLYDISGRRVLYDSGILTQDRITIDNEVNYLPSGVYLLRISTGDMDVVRTISIIH